MTTLGARLSHMLTSRGVDTVFGIPGVHNVELYRAIGQAGLRHVLARHEQGAGFMADGYARATGRPGVCYLISGPGFLNAATALGQSYSDSVPVLAIAACLDEAAAQRGQLHQMRDQEGAGRAICDWSETARSAQTAYALIDRALAECASARPRPKALHIPIATLSATADPAPASPPRPPRPHATHDQITAAVDAVLGARRPLMIFGGGALGGAGAIPALLRQTGAAAFTTYAGRGLVPPDHPHGFGSFLARPDSARVAAEADLILAFGTELSETDLWRDRLGHDAPMIRVDLDPEVLATCRPGDRPILGDAGAFLHAMAIAIPARTGDRAPCWDIARIAATRARWRAEVQAERPGLVDLADALRSAMPEDAMIFSDMTQLAYGALEVWDMPRPGHWHHPSGFGTLGYALPAAIGGAVGRPGLPTACLIGDYGLQYTLAELATAVELDLPLPILLWDNGKLGEIEDSMTRAQIAPNAVHQRNPDFLALAKAYGADAVEPATLRALQDALRAAFAAPRPTVIRMTPALV